MVNMYGAGKAFNLQYARNTFGAGQLRYNPKPTVNIFTHSQPATTNITVQNGPGGFRFFMRGLFNGLFGDWFGGFPGMGGCFGGLGGFGGLEGNYGLSALNTPTADQLQQKQDSENYQRLLTAFKDSKITIVPEGNGKFSALKDGKYIAQDMTYNDIRNAISKYEPQGSEVKQPETKEKAKPGEGPEVKGNAETGSTPTATQKPNEGEVISGNKPVEPQGASVSNTSVANAVDKTGAASKTPAKSGAKRVQVPEGWSKDEGWNIMNEIGGIGEIKRKCKNGGSHAFRLAQLILNKYGLSLGSLKNFTEDIIKFNPSVFTAGGMFKEPIVIDKLDLPSKEYLIKKYPKSPIS